MYSSMQWIWICNRIYLYEVESWHEWYDSYCTCMYLGQKHLETNFAETNFPNAKTPFWANHSAQISVVAVTNFPNTKTVIWANQNAQISVFTFGKLFSRWFCSRSDKQCI